MDDIVGNVDRRIKDLISIKRTTFFDYKGMKKVLICFHGYQTRNIHDLQEFKNYFEEKNRDKNCEVYLANLYDFGDKTTYNQKLMYDRARSVTKAFIDKGYLVYVLAYSFSAGIGARICEEFPEISKLVLVSPTTYLLKTKLLINYLKVAYNHIKFRIKFKKKASSIMKKTKMAGIVKLSYAISVSIVINRKHLKKLRCKIFMIKGLNDEFSISNTFSYVSNKAKRAITVSKIYPGRNHTMIINRETGIDEYNDILKFVFHMNISEDSLEII